MKGAVMGAWEQTSGLLAEKHSRELANVLVLIIEALTRGPEKNVGCTTPQLNVPLHPAPLALCSHRPIRWRGERYS